MSATVRKMVRRLTGYRTAMQDEMRALAERGREKQERARNLQLDVIKAERRHDEIAGDRWNFATPEHRQRALEEAADELQDLRGLLADVQEDLAVLETRREQLASDFYPAAKLAETVAQLAGVKHEDMPGVLATTGMPHVLSTAGVSS